MHYLKTGAAKLGIELSSAQLEQFSIYYRELLEWNQRINLTSITDLKDVQIKHFLDSLSVTPALKQPIGGRRFLDVGAGSGFPGLPLKIAFPAMKLVLLEATVKKAAFLRHLAEKLEFDNVDIVVGRAEEVARQHRRAGLV
ncbi:16S rRNA (guanine(527)-N(7))-methyltransferase RsmG, partial [Chloroflexota bacterium]